MARYALASHVFVCLRDEHLVFLDLKEDRYFALEAALTAGLGSWVSGWPVATPDGGSDAKAPIPEATDVLEVLQGRGLLAATVPPGKDATPVTAVTPVRELTSETEPSTGPGVGSWFTFFMASMLAKMALRTWPFERVIGRVRRRKELLGARADALNVERARKLVEGYARYRVFLFSSKNECLNDSLSLLEFLARYGIFPNWVFGVQTRPFAAHCWVQHGDIVFNDTVEHVSGYTPIMVV
jgi:hypothetical protein